MPHRTALLTRVTALTGETLHFTMPAYTGRRRSRVEFIDKERVPEFEGDQAWFEIEKVSAKPWPYWRALRRVDPPATG